MQEQSDLNDRLSLIERMIAEGRCSTEHWGWCFVLWGVAYYVAMAWSAWGPASELAWPVTMVAAAALTAIVVARRSHDRAETTIGRAVGSVWFATGIAMFVLLASLGFSGQVEFHTFVAIIAGMMGAASAASGMILKWRAQLACGAFWWAAAVAACFGTHAQVMAVFLAAIFFCQIVFGAYAMVREARRQSRGDVAHA